MGKFLIVFDDVKDFRRFVTPSITNKIQTITKNSREKQKICQECKKETKLHGAHKHGFDRNTIIEEHYLKKYKNTDGIYKVDNLKQLIDDIIKFHKVNKDEIFRYLCLDCHHKYDHPST